MFFVDGERPPSLHGTGSEDYLCHAWGCRTTPTCNGTAWAESTQATRGRSASTATTSWIRAIHQSLRASIEHGHANDRAMTGPAHAPDGKLHSLGAHAQARYR